ncbi:DmsE family decaheme c-type cytochrome [Mangrovimicrobium sediminis]|nr:DmsE family decaheme c-type cytochrome [Haliea sp. SAOS-164]
MRARLLVKATRCLQALALLALFGAGSATAEDGPGCLDCHSPEPDSPVHAIYDNVHGTLEGGGANACTACHGASEVHDRRGKRAAPDVSFGPRWPADLETRNGACVSCHASGDQLLWTGSAHQQEDMACTDCHTLHRASDPILDDRQATAFCGECHSQVRGELRLPSHHPIAEGELACGDCHNPHGSAGDAALRETSINDNCLGCHQEKRGPFLWEHEPVSEDCSLCHRSHGSVHDRLLVARGPALCQQCHSAAFHPSVPYGGESLGGNSGAYVVGKDCLNCHGQVHGSNHPSGARLTR